VVESHSVVDISLDYFLEKLTLSSNTTLPACIQIGDQKFLSLCPLIGIEFLNLSVLWDKSDELTFQWSHLDKVLYRYSTVCEPSRRLDLISDFLMMPIIFVKPRAIGLFKLIESDKPFNSKNVNQEIETCLESLKVMISHIATLSSPSGRVVLSYSNRLAMWVSLSHDENLKTILVFTGPRHQRLDPAVSCQRFLMRPSVQEIPEHLVILERAKLVRLLFQLNVHGPQVARLRVSWLLSHTAKELRLRRVKALVEPPLAFQSSCWYGLFPARQNVSFSEDEMKVLTHLSTDMFMEDLESPYDYPTFAIGTYQLSKLFEALTSYLSLGLSIHSSVTQTAIIKLAASFSLAEVSYKILVLAARHTLYLAGEVEYELSRGGDLPILIRKPNQLS